MNTHEIQQLVTLLAFRDWRFVVTAELHGAPFLVLEFDEPCNVTGQPAVQRSRKWRLSPHMTRSEIVQTALKAVLTAMEHEVREQFLYRDKPIFGPHFDVDALHRLCGAGATDTRVPATAVPSATLPLCEKCEGTGWQPLDCDVPAYGGCECGIKPDKPFREDDPHPQFA